MNRTILSMVALVITAASLHAQSTTQSSAQSIVGTWQGTLAAGTGPVRIAIALQKKADGSLQGGFKWIDRDDGSLLDSVTRSASDVSFSQPMIGLNLRRVSSAPTARPSMERSRSTSSPSRSPSPSPRRTHYGSAKAPGRCRPWPLMPTLPLKSPPSSPASWWNMACTSTSPHGPSSRGMSPPRSSSSSPGNVRGRQVIGGPPWDEARSI